MSESSKIIEITQKNKIIQSFMSPSGKYNDWYDKMLHYQDNYDCIMRVVSNIESLSHPLTGGEDKFRFAIERNSCCITLSCDPDWKIIHTDGSKIKSIFETCVLFINWYINKKNERE